MAFLRCNFYSNALNMNTDVNIIMPEEETDKPQKVLYLLHGLCGDHSDWSRKTSIERYVEGMNLVVIMPSVHRSFYADMYYGLKYWTYVSEELPRKLKNMFNITDKREDTFVAGLSMGGYGAMKLALRYPERFCAAGTFSGAVHLAGLEANKEEFRKENPELVEEFYSMFGDRVTGTDNDLIHVANGFNDNMDKPLIYQCCGTEDFLYMLNIACKEHLKTVGFDITYKEHEGEDHTWSYWDMSIKDFLSWLQEKGLLQ